MTRLAVILAFALPACAEDDPPPEIIEGESAGIDNSPVAGDCDEMDNGDPYADCVESFAPADDASFGHDGLPDIVLGPPNGLGDAGGSMDIVSLGCGGQITLFFDEPGIVDGPGPDLLVFENPFVMNDETFAEPARVLVSDDGVTWGGFGCELDGMGTWPPNRLRGHRARVPPTATPEATRSTWPTWACPTRGTFGWWTCPRPTLATRCGASAPRGASTSTRWRRWSTTDDVCCSPRCCCCYPWPATRPRSPRVGSAIRSGSCRRRSTPTRSCGRWARTCAPASSA